MAATSAPLSSVLYLHVHADNTHEMPLLVFGMIFMHMRQPIAASVAVNCDPSSSSFASKHWPSTWSRELNGRAEAAHMSPNMSRFGLLAIVSRDRCM